MTPTEIMSTTQPSDFYITRVSLLYYNKDSSCDYGTQFNKLREIFQALQMPIIRHCLLCRFLLRR